MTTTNSLENLVQKYRIERANFTEFVKYYLSDIVKEKLKDDPNEYVFYGYTPYFNDGDECVYRFYLRDFYDNVPDFIKEIEHNIPFEIIRDVYGDHKQLIFSRYGILVEHLDHE